MIGTIVGTYYASKKGASWGKSAAIGIGIDVAIGVALIAVPLATAAIAGSIGTGASVASAVNEGVQGLGRLSGVSLGSRAAAAVVHRYGPGVLPPAVAAPSTTLGAGFRGCRGC